MDKKIVEKNIKQIIKDNNLHEELFVIDKNILDAFYNALNVSKSYVHGASMKKLSMIVDKINRLIRTCRDLTNHIYFDEQNHIYSSINYINNILEELHPSHEIDLNKLINDLKLSYLDYISKAECLLDYLEEVVRNNFENYFNLKIIRAYTIPSFNLERILECTHYESMEEITITITMNGDIKFKFDRKELHYKLVLKDHPLKSIDRPIENLFTHEMNKLNFQQIIDKINIKSYLFNQNFKVSSEISLIKHILASYKKYSFDVLKIKNEKRKEIA